jgi:phospholipid N-methyltransferase
LQTAWYRCEHESGFKMEIPGKLERARRGQRIHLQKEAMDNMDDMQCIQELGHSADHDYRVGSPHLKHWKLHERLVSAAKTALADVVERNLPRTVLEVGAGHGGFTEPILAAGFDTTVTEMSRPSLVQLKMQFALNPGFCAVFDPDGSLGALGTRRFAVILYSSVLHHIPDYISAIRTAIREHLLDGGALVSLQDPIWYPALRWKDSVAASASYLIWRLGQGEYLRGAKTRLRRAAGILSPNEPADMVEYHVVRSGINQAEILKILNSDFESVRLIPYWSTQSAFFQCAGERLGLRSTFAIIALGCNPRKLAN